MGPGLEFDSNARQYIFRISIGFCADADPAFYLNADSDPDPGQTLPSQKVGFYMKNILW